MLAFEHIGHCRDTCFRASSLGLNLAVTACLIVRPGLIITPLLDRF